MTLQLDHGLKCVEGIWLPEQEAHLIEFLQQNRGTYQFNTLVRSLELAPGRRVAIDIGAHVGLWSMHLAKEFAQVYAFEPVQLHRECFARNVSASNVDLLPFALGNKAGEAKMVWDPTNTGHTHIGDTGIPTELRTLDSFLLESVDFIKIDAEGYEVFILEGALDLIKRCKPVICIEQKSHGYYGVDRYAGINLLRAMGATMLGRINDDYICGWMTRRQKLVHIFDSLRSKLRLK